MEKTVYLIRHGATPGNLEKRYIGRTDEDLLPAADVQAMSGAQAAPYQATSPSSLNRPWGVNTPDRILASSMKRARQTVALLFGDVQPTVVEDLREIDFGCFEGKSHAELDGDPAYQAWIDSNCTLPIPGGESRDDFAERSFTAFLSALGDPLKNETIAIVCHGGNIMAILSRLTGRDFYDFHTENLCGFCLKLEINDAGIHDLTYQRFSLGDPA